jgi:hypothetical protein
MIRTLSLSLALSLVAVFAACDSQVDGDHQGTPLAEIGGTVRNTRTQPVENTAEVVLIWENSSGSPDIIATDTVEVEGSFPAQFKLSIFEPPEDAVLNDWDGTKVGVAFIVAGEAGTDYATDEEGILGIEDDHLFVYVPDGVAPGSEASIVLRGTPAPGFHMYGVHKLSDGEMESRRACIEGLGENATLENTFSTCGGFDLFDDFVPLETDLETPLEIELVDDLSTVDIPNWT